jgi:hypothetical protein
VLCAGGGGRGRITFETTGTSPHLGAAEAAPAARGLGLEGVYRFMTGTAVGVRSSCEQEEGDEEGRRLSWDSAETERADTGALGERFEVPLPTGRDLEEEGEAMGPRG